MRRTILIADDSPTIQRLVKQTFSDGDFEIISVSNGDAAIKKFEEIRPDAVLADIYMPGKTGYEVCEYVKRHPALSATPVVLLVGPFDAFDEDKATRAGADANITKPFEPSALVALVTSVMPVPRKTPALKPAAHKPVAQPPLPQPSLVQQPVPQQPLPAPEDDPVSDEDDVLGLESLFADEEPQSITADMSDEDVNRIADRVIQRLSIQAIENIAWEIVPDITERIVREELKRTDET